MRKFKLFCVLLILILLLSGCTSQQKPISLKKLSDDLVKNVTFHDELTLADEKIVEMLYNIENAVNSYVYISSGATAEEIAVFEFKDEDSTRLAVTKAKLRISEQKGSFALYIPEEVKKLDNAIIKESGCYLVVCVSDGIEAEKIISKYIK